MEIPGETPEGETRIPVEKTKNVEKVAVELEEIVNVIRNKHNNQ